jgi:hypothetical protein
VDWSGWEKGAKIAGLMPDDRGERRVSDGWWKQSEARCGRALVAVLAVAALSIAWIGCGGGNDTTGSVQQGIEQGAEEAEKGLEKGKEEVEKGFKEAEEAAREGGGGAKKEAQKGLEEAKKEAQKGLEEGKRQAEEGLEKGKAEAERALKEAEKYAP